MKSSVNDDLATLRRIVNNVPFDPRDGHDSLDRVEAEIARLTDAASESKSGLVTRLMQRAEAAETEAARLRDGLRLPLQLLYGIDYEQGSRIDQAVTALEALADGAAVEHRENIVEVYDHRGHYLGCMGIETWRRLLSSNAA